MINHTDSPLPEELQSQSNSHPTGKDEQQHDTSLSDLPQMEAPVGNGHSSAEGEPIAQTQPPVFPPQGRRGVIKGRTGVMNHAPTTHWLIIGLIILVLIAGSASALVFLHPFSPAPATTATPVVVSGQTTVPGATSVINHAPTVSTCPGSTSATCSATATRTSSTPVAGNGNNGSTVDLTFSGAVMGPMTVTNVVACGPGQSIAGGQQYYVAIFGTVSGQQYGFTFTVYPYTDPRTGVMNHAPTVSSFFGPAGEANSLTAWHASPNLGVNVTINNDGKSGTLDIGYVNSSNNNNTARVSGNWKCA